MSHVRPRTALGKRKLRKDTKSSVEAEAEMDSQSAQFEPIAVLVRPWIRLNGYLNRKVLDRFLGSILSYVMERPGIKGEQISKKFWPALQPAHTYELLETLIQIECLKRSKIIINAPVTLFSKRIPSKLGMSVLLFLILGCQFFPFLRICT